MKNIILAWVLVAGLAAIGLSACSLHQSAGDATSSQQEHVFHHTD